MKTLGKYCSYAFISATLLSGVGANLASAVDVVDDRKVIVFTAEEYAAGLQYMRDTLLALQNILKGASEDDMKEVARAARVMATPMNEIFSEESLSKTSGEFRLLLNSMPKNFEHIAVDADSAKDPNLTVLQVSQLMARCLACHREYRAIGE